MSKNKDNITSIHEEKEKAESEKQQQDVWEQYKTQALFHRLIYDSYIYAKFERGAALELTKIFIKNRNRLLRKMQEQENWDICMFYGEYDDCSECSICAECPESLCFKCKECLETDNNTDCDDCNKCAGCEHNCFKE
jgi:hypothetical protein